MQYLDNIEDLDQTMEEGEVDRFVTAWMVLAGLAERMTDPAGIRTFESACHKAGAMVMEALVAASADAPGADDAQQAWFRDALRDLAALEDILDNMDEYFAAVLADIDEEVDFVH